MRGTGRRDMGATTYFDIGSTTYFFRHKEAQKQKVRICDSATSKRTRRSDALRSLMDDCASGSVEFQRDQVVIYRGHDRTKRGSAGSTSIPLSFWGS